MILTAWHERTFVQPWMPDPVSRQDFALQALGQFSTALSSRCPRSRQSATLDASCGAVMSISQGRRTLDLGWVDNVAMMGA